MSGVTVSFSDQDGEAYTDHVTTGGDGSYTLRTVDPLNLDADIEATFPGLSCPNPGLSVAQAGNLCNLPLRPTPASSDAHDAFLSDPASGEKVDWQAVPVVIDSSLSEQFWESGENQDQSNGSSTWQAVKAQS
jgi:hypothetical protein